jgi:hypothetical protein
MDIDVRRDVLPWLKDAGDARRLLEHPHVHQLTSDQNGFHFLPQGAQNARQVRGLTAPLAEVFWPEEFLVTYRDRMKKIKKKPTTGKKTGVAMKKSKTAVPNNVISAARGRLRGNIVHGQLEDLIALDSTHFNRKYTLGAHEWSYWVIQTLNDANAKPLAAECAVFHDQLNIATRLDLIGVTKSGCFLFFELKTGYESNEEWEGATSWMSGVLRDILVDSAKNRAIVQVVIGALMTIKSRGLVGAFECWVIHVTSEEIHFIHVNPTFVRAYGEAMYESLIKHQAERSKKRFGR